MLKSLDTVSKVTDLLRRATREIDPAKTYPVKEYEEDWGGGGGGGGIKVNGSSRPK